jgi:hypothetical protein
MKGNAQRKGANREASKQKVYVVHVLFVNFPAGSAMIRQATTAAETQTAGAAERRGQTRGGSSASGWPGMFQGSRSLAGLTALAR